jgi:sigma-B regulation protein RsbU (phosphoserine phosphatase)
MSANVIDTRETPAASGGSGLISLVKTLSHFDSPLQEIFSSVNQYFYALLANDETVMLSHLGLGGDECQITYQKSHAMDTSWRCVDLLNTSKANPTYKSEFIATVNSVEQPTVIADVNADTGLPQMVRQYPSLLILPIYLNGVSKHKLLLFLREHRRLSSQDMEKLVLVANLLMSYLIHNCEIKSLNDANKWIEKEVSDVGNLLKMLLPQRDAEIRGVEVATSYKPCEHAGGDYYDLVPLTKVFWPGQADGNHDYWGAIIADSAGHGAAAAVEVAMFDAILRTYRGNPDAGPAGVFNYANQYLFTRLIRGTFLTAFIANYNPFNKTLRFCNAGHPPALLIRVDGSLEHLDNPKGIPLAVNREFRWHNGQVDFHPGDVLILYTDGVTEAAAPDGNLFGMERLIDAATNGAMHAHAIAQRVEAALARHRDGRKQKDDQTFIVIKLVTNNENIATNHSD